MKDIEDINFLPGYGKVNEIHEKGSFHTFEFENEYGRITCGFIKRSLEEFGAPGFYDIITPYGYGGEVIWECAENKKVKLVQCYKEAFRKYCMDNKIICYFARFNPILGNAKDFVTCFDSMNMIRNVVAIDLKKDLLAEEFKKKVKQKLRAAQRDQVEIQLDKEGTTLKNFMDMYCNTMNKKAASDFYYFPEAYFRAFYQYLPDCVEIYNAMVGGRIVSGMFMLVYGSTAYYHLSASRKDHKLRYEQFALISECAFRLKERGYHWLVLGGGLSGSLEDSLFLFKQQFSVGPYKKFYVGTKIFDYPKYEELCQINGRPGMELLDPDFFPKYRALWESMKYAEAE